jgi:hypothetical protein
LDKITPLDYESTGLALALTLIFYQRGGTKPLQDHNALKF